MSGIIEFHIAPDEEEVAGRRHRFERASGRSLLRVGRCIEIQVLGVLNLALVRN